MHDIRSGDGDSPRYLRSSAHNEPRRRTRWNTLGGRVISLVSRKGGVGKTTSAVNLGAALALSGHTVLVVGVDPQCGVCRTLGVKPHELPVCLTEIFSADAHLTDLAQPAPVDDLFFVSPRILSLAEEEMYLKSMEMRAMDFVREIDRARSLYDTILIDCPPALGPATQAALLASDSYLVPVQTEELCRETLDSLLEFVETFRDRNFRSGDPENGDPGATPLALEGLFLTMDIPKTRMGRHVATRVNEDFGGFLFGAAIPRTVRLGEMALRGKPAVIYDRRSRGSRSYFDLADELVSRYSVERQTDLEFVRESAPRPSAGNGDGAREKFTVGGLERLLGDLDGDDASGREPQGEPFGGPEMVSLDDLLDEEESRSNGDDWDEERWSSDQDPNRPN